MKIDRLEIVFLLVFAPSLFEMSPGLAPFFILRSHASEHNGHCDRWAPSEPFYYLIRFIAVDAVSLEIKEIGTVFGISISNKCYSQPQIPEYACHSNYLDPIKNRCPLFQHNINIFSIPSIHNSMYFKYNDVFQHTINIK